MHMHVIQQRAAARVVAYNNESSVTDNASSDDGNWVSNPFQQYMYYLFLAAKGGFTNDTINPPENVKIEDNLKESNSVKECLRNIAFDHSYEPPHGFRGSRSNLEGNQTDLILDDEETEDADAKVKDNHWKPVRQVKEQFIIRTNPLTNHQISSFDVAGIEELNPDGSPVDKMHVVSSCAVHGEYEQGFTMCTSQPASKPMFGNAAHGAHLRCIDNKFNRIPHVKSREKKADESFDVTENGENDGKEFINKLISDLSNKKKNKQPLICKLCGNWFTAVATLKNHYRSHGNIKMYACSLCDSSFTRRYGLNYHMTVHTGKFRYTCSECSRQFRHTTHFKAHCRDHSCGKPLQCALCPSSFKNRNTLKRHVKTKHLSTEGQK